MAGLAALGITEFYLNVLPKEVLREFREKWYENSIGCVTPNRSKGPRK